MKSTRLNGDSQSINQPEPDSIHAALGVRNLTPGVRQVLASQDYLEPHQCFPNHYHAQSVSARKLLSLLLSTSRHTLSIFDFPSSTRVKLDPHLLHRLQCRQAESKKISSVFGMMGKRFGDGINECHVDSSVYQRFCELIRYLNG